MLLGIIGAEGMNTRRWARFLLFALSLFALFAMTLRAFCKGLFYEHVNGLRSFALSLTFPEPMFSVKTWMLFKVLDRV